MEPDVARKSEVGRSGETAYASPPPKTAYVIASQKGPAFLEKRRGLPRFSRSEIHGAFLILRRRKPTEEKRGRDDEESTFPLGKYKGCDLSHRKENLSLRGLPAATRSNPRRGHDLDSFPSNFLLRSLSTGWTPPE